MLQTENNDFGPITDPTGRSTVPMDNSDANADITVILHVCIFWKNHVRFRRYQLVVQTNRRHAARQNVCML